MRPRRLGISAVLALVAVMVLGGLCSGRQAQGEFRRISLP